MEAFEDVAKKFLEEYKKLTEKYKVQVVASPMWMQRDDGTFSTVIDLKVVPKKD